MGIEVPTIDDIQRGRPLSAENTTTCRTSRLRLGAAAAEFLPAVRRDIGQVDPAVRLAINECVNGRSPWPLFIHGAAGTGKSCAALCLADRVRRSRFYVEEQLVDILADAKCGRLFNNFGYEVFPNTIWGQLESAPLVIVDEIGARVDVSDHRYTTIKTLLDKREGKPLVLVSNLAPPEVPRVYSDRVGSRALCGTRIKAGGPDRRFER